MSQQPNDNNNNMNNRPGGPGRGGPKGRPEAPGPRIGRQLLIWVVVFAVIFGLASYLNKSASVKTEDVDSKRFFELLDKGRIKELHAKGNELVATVTPEGEKAEGQPSKEIKLPVPPDFLGRHWQELSDKVQGEITYQKEGGWLFLILVNSIPVILLFVLIWYVISRQMRAMSASAENFPFAKSRVHAAHLEKTNVKFSDVAGVEEAKQEVKEIVDFLQSPEKYRRIGGRIPRGEIGRASCRERVCVGV